LIAHDGPAGKEYRLHAIVQPFYYGELGKRERVRLHQVAGAYYETEERDALRAAIHYDRAGDYARAADLATTDVWALINAGQARVACQLIERFLVRQIEPPESNHLDPERWAAVQAALGTIYDHLGERQLAQQMYQEAFEYLQKLPDSLAVWRLKARVCMGMGASLRHEAPQSALEWIRRGRDGLDARELQPEAAALQILMGSAHMRIGEYQEALEAVHRGLAMLPAGHSQLHADGLNLLGIMYGSKGDIEQRDTYSAQALVVCRELHDSLRTISILSNLAVDKYVTGDWAGAIADCREALSLAEQLGSQTHRLGLIQNLGIMLINSGDDAAALDYLTKNRALAHANRVIEYEIGCLIGLADLYLRRDEPEEAIPLLTEAEQLIAQTNMNNRLSETYRFWSQAHHARDQAELALEYVDRALQQARDLEEPFDEGLALRIQGQILHAAGQPKAALAAFERSLELLADDPYELARTQVLYGQALRAGGDEERGNALLEQARAVFAQLGAQRDLTEVEALLAG
jgi:tetratricopeptide (TPR) repeat protein